MDINSYLKEKSGLVNSYLASYFGRSFSAPRVIEEAMRYSLLAGGKRLRPALCMAAYEACGGRGEEIVDCASAIEVIHTYSLIHDDLPAMDNDDLRRGRPTSHKVYGEAVAILAGDGLLTEAFLIILNAEKPGHARLNALRELSAAAGIRGMVGGQAQDIISEDSEPDAETLHYIHTHKTGALIAASVKMGGILLETGRDSMAALSTYGENLGLAFQIVDDILDVKGDAGLLGKPTGSDEKKKKMTYPSLYGLEASMKKAEELAAAATAALTPFGGGALALGEIANYIIKRTH